MTSQQLEHMGQLLFGSDWKLPLAVALDVNERTVRRWAAGTTAIPDGVDTDIGELASQRIGQLVKAISKFT